MADAKILDELLYTSQHEWVRVEGGSVTMGITDFAQHSLGDIMFVELPAMGREFARGASLGVIESVKAAEDYYSPVSGKVTSTNGGIQGNPAVVNQDCYGAGWFVKMDLTGDIKSFNLLSASDYRKLVEGLAH